MLRGSFAFLLASAVALALGGCGTKEHEPDPVPERPNILLVVVDDMGYSDLGAFGGEIPTPNLDALAFEGVRFTNFITSPVCSPTRASLLTGVDPHLAGLGNLAEELSPNQEGQPGYEGYLNDRVVTIASLLRDAGYRTFMTGKWHLGKDAEMSPAARGFDRSFAMLTNASHFSDMRPAYSPDPEAKAMYRDDGRMIDVLPRGFDYSSQFFVDRMIEYLDPVDGAASPFFGYLAFSAPHWPLQAPDAALEAFRGRYDEGYDVMLERRLAEQKRLGLIPADAVAAARSPKGRPWKELDEAGRAVEARAMEVYAAMIAEIDRHTGRLIDYLGNRGMLDNTVVIFLSDNGAEGHDLDDTWPADQFPEIRAVIDQRHDFSLENMGRPGSYTFYGPNWARVSAPAFRLFKAFPTEGGVRTAAFAWYPPRFRGGTLVDDLVLVRDIAPTILDLAGVRHPSREYRGREVQPMTGRSAVDLLAGGVQSAVRLHVDEAIGKISVRRGAWKMVRMPPPHGTGSWELYDLDGDLAERRDLAASRPEIVAELEAAWNRYVDDNGVILPDWLSGY
ncbi:MAG: arylsulfatase [Woeseiaceae bacterium]|jgi:arylsulfatase|nr:arylsulfatase [Woeseiaceae bacterium]